MRSNIAIDFKIIISKKKLFRHLFFFLAPKTASSFLVFQVFLCLKGTLNFRAILALQFEEFQNLLLFRDVSETEARYVTAHVCITTSVLRQGFLFGGESLLCDMRPIRTLKK